MIINFNCPNCGNTIEADDSEIGFHAECPHCLTGFVIPEPKVETGSHIRGFQLGPLLGEGAMGKVYLATQVSMNRHVALKILPEEIKQSDDQAIESFMNEMVMLAKLDHPNIVSALEAGEVNGIYYLAMQYVNGECLVNRLQREGQLPEREVLEYGLQIASALDYAWDKHNLLHRDIKPSNIMLDNRNTLKLMDLGLAKISSDEEGKSAFVVGTPHYMSPEQAKGNPLDWRTDQYSMGATLYHLITGRTPFESEDSVIVMHKHITDPLVHPKKRNPDISSETNSAICKMMAKSPDKRFDSWQAVLHDLEKCLTNLDKPKSVPKKSTVNKNKSSVKRRPQTRTNITTTGVSRYRPRKKSSPVPIILIVVIVLLLLYAVFAILNKGTRIQIGQYDEPTLSQKHI